MSIKDFVTRKFAEENHSWHYAIRCRSYSIKNLDDIKKAIYGKAKGTVYAAAQLYHIHMKKKPPYSIAYDWLAEQIRLYLNDGLHVASQGHYDKWHKQVCEEFINQCKAIGCSVAYGTAQKVVNIAMKYCYCFGDADIAENLDKFKYCHVALDGYIYFPTGISRVAISTSRYYKRISFKGFETPFYSVTVNPLFITKTATPWSKLSFDEYKKIQSEIIDYLKVKNVVTYGDVKHLDTLSLAGCPDSEKLTPFQVEYLLW